MLPDYVKQYFWEVDVDKLDPAKRANYVIERILEYGDTDAVAWMLETYPKHTIIEVIKSSRSLSQKSANYWALMFNLPKNQIICFSKQFRKTSRAIWNL